MSKKQKVENRLSKNLLQMKFMKKTKDKEVRECETEETNHLYGRFISDGMKTATSNYVIEPSIAVCQGLKCGRMSFNGMNPELERIMREEEIREQLKNCGRIIKEEDVEVTAEEMATAYENYKVDSKKRKYPKKNWESDDHAKKKIIKQFLKPDVD